MADNDRDFIRVPLPRVNPLGAEVSRADVKDVWDIFVKPHQESGEVQSVEMRTLMAILRSVYAGLPLMEGHDR